MQVMESPLILLRFLGYFHNLLMTIKSLKSLHVMQVMESPLILLRFWGIFGYFHTFYNTYIISKCASVVCRLSAQVFNNNLTTSGRIFKVGVLYERYIHGQQMSKKIILVEATPRAYRPVLHFADFFRKI